MSKSICTIAKLNLRNIKAAYITSGLLMITMFVQSFINYIVASRQGGQNVTTLSGGALVYLLILLAAIRIPSKNFRRIINLGGKRTNFFWGTILSYIILVIIASLFNTLVFYTVDRFLQQSGYLGELFGGILNLIEVFGWTQNGPIIAFFQQTAFLFLLATTIHTLTSIQGKWFGWMVNILLIVILSVFIPITPLRSTLVWFFNMIIFQNALIQILSCIGLGAALYALNKPIFARKVI